MQVYGLGSPSLNGIWPEVKLKAICRSSLDMTAKEIFQIHIIIQM